MRDKRIGHQQYQPMDWAPATPPQRHAQPAYQQPAQPQYNQNQQWGQLQGREQRPTSMPPRSQVRLPNVVDPQLARLESQPNMQGVQLMTGTAFALLDQAGVNARLGGSIVARMNGGQRQPQDIDLELRNPQSLDHAFQTLANANHNITREDGSQGHVTGRPLEYNPGMGGVVQLTFTDSYTRQQSSVNVDLTNENNAVFNRNLRSPEERGVGGSRGFVQAPELVMNYLDRLIYKSETGIRKGDPQQIANILRQHGFDMNNPGHLQALESEIHAHARPEAVPAYGQAMSQILEGMRTGQL